MSDEIIIKSLVCAFALILTVALLLTIKLIQKSDAYNDLRTQNNSLVKLHKDLIDKYNRLENENIVGVCFAGIIAPSFYELLAAKKNNHKKTKGRCTDEKNTL